MPGHDLHRGGVDDDIRVDEGDERRRHLRKALVPCTPDAEILGEQQSLGTMADRNPLRGGCVVEQSSTTRIRASG